MNNNTSTIWKDLLLDASSKNRKLNGNILVLGDKDSGKKQLISCLEKLAGSEIRPEPLTEYSIFREITDYEKTYLMDYRFMIVNSKENDDIEIGKINFYIINDILNNLDTLLNPEIIENMMIMIVLDFTKPWTFLNELMKWMELINDKIIKISQKFPLEKLQIYINNLAEKIKNMNKKIKNEDISFEMTYNMGFPICVVCNKCDNMNLTKKEKESEMINYTLRNFCSNYSASLIYTSSKFEINTNILYNYINYLLLNHGTVDKIDLNNDSFFITNCYENSEILNQIFPNCNNIAYEDVVQEQILNKTKKKFDTSEEISHQKFLNELKNGNRNNTFKKDKMADLLSQSKQL